MRKLLILGGDGYIGWPASMFFSSTWDVTIIDSLIKREWESMTNGRPLIPVPNIHERVHIWEKVSGRHIDVRIGDIKDAALVYGLLGQLRPDAVIHFAEQPSAPYSMASRDHAVETQMNNVIGTLNLIFAIRDIGIDTHLIKIGTMGEYGTPNIDIEEGFLEIAYKGRKDVLPFPKQPGSFYHLSKVFDSQNLLFAAPIWGLRVTDLNQGVVYGIETKDTECAEGLHTSFHYDSVFGTVINRFCVQAVLGFPLTIYGSGSQKRSFINLSDSLQCIHLSLEAPPKRGEYRVFNQFTEVFSIFEVAEIIEQAGAEFDLQVEIAPLENPRAEKSDHHYNPSNKNLLNLGLCQKNLSDVILREIFRRILKYKDMVNRESLLPRIKWRR